MLSVPTVFLMYHELELENRRLCNQEAGYTRYVLAESDFRKQMLRMNELGFTGLSLSEALLASSSQQKGIVITFDDGCETDLLAAAPTLKELQFNATFYVVAGFIGKTGYLSAKQLCELSDLGFEIGSHSMTHRYLSELPEDDLKFEISASKELLEQIISKKVHHFSCPGGRWSKLAAEIAKDSGYETMSTSNIGINGADSDNFSLSRICIMRDTPLVEFEQTCRAEAIKIKLLRQAAFSTAKSLLGNTLYEKLRNKLLRAF
jgi:peptidoglycan/xylan/chitin deacetylase (PgdA/CDA1 family)